jgi:hypothetical protein
MIDVAGVVRGASRGFSVFLVGELVAIAVGLVSGGLGSVVFALTAAAGPVTAGLLAARSGPPVIQGASAAVLAYVLTVPLRLAGPGLPASEAVFSVVVAAVLGAVAGRMAGRTARS